jgi:hypothetical protein
VFILASAWGIGDLPATDQKSLTRTACGLLQLPAYHAGDIIVSLDAQVSGGIGPQRSVSSMIIKSQGS